MKIIFIPNIIAKLSVSCEQNNILYTTLFDLEIGDILFER